MFNAFLKALIAACFMLYPYYRNFSAKSIKFTGFEKSQFLTKLAISASNEPIFKNLDNFPMFFR